jgi:hypothetical protein
MATGDKLATLDGLKSAYDSGKGMIAPDYANLTFPVTAGTYCIYGGALYYAKQDIASSEAWTAAHWQAAKVGQEVAELKSAIENISTVIDPSDLSQWLYAEDKYLNASYELTAASGYNTYKIPVEHLDFVSFVWTGNNPFGTLGDSYRYTYEDNNGYSRSLTSANIVIDTTNKNIIFLAPSNAIAIYFSFKASEIASGFTVNKNTALSYDPNINYFRNFILPVNEKTCVLAEYYLRVISGTNTIYRYANASYKTWWTKVKAGDTVKFGSAVSGLSFNAIYIDTSDTITQITGLSHTFATDATVVIYEKTDNLGNAVIVPAGLKLQIDSSNVQGLSAAIADGTSQLSADVSELNGNVDDIEAKFTGEDATYTTGTESGYYRVNNGAIETKSSSSYTRTKIEVQSWMKGTVSYTIVSNENISDSVIFCAFSDSNDAYISQTSHAVGGHTEQIPSNAKYIYLCFYGSAYCSDYTIAADKVCMESELERLGVDNPFDGLTGVAFGTSLTYRAQTTGGFLQYLPDMSGITFDNQGVGSSEILGDGGNLDMLAKIKAYTGYSGKRVCLLEGFVNDWYGQNTLGAYTDAAETTVCGCVRSALNYILSQNANLTVFLILDPYGRNYNSVDCSSSVQRNSKTQFEYYEEIAKVAESLGIPVIKEYAGSQISENTPQYFIDNIHPNALGAKQSANFIWSQMRRYMPNAVS